MINFLVGLAIGALAVKVYDLLVENGVIKK